MQEFLYPKSPLPIKNLNQARVAAGLWNGGASCPLYKFARYGTIGEQGLRRAIDSLRESLEWAEQDGAGEDAVELKNLISFFEEMPCTQLH